MLGLIEEVNIMEYLRRYLIFLRRKENEDNLLMRISTVMLIASLVGILIGILMDWLIPHSYFPNMIRGVIAVVSGFTLFSYSYLAAVKFSSRRLDKDRYYKTMRERFSHRQRVNFSIAIGVLIVSFIMLSKGYGLTFTLKSIIAIYLTFVLVSFSRRNRNEFIKDIYEIPDIRDLEAEKIRKEARSEKEE